MAAALLERRAGGALTVLSAGSAPVERVNPAAVAALAELGIDIANERPKLLTDAAARRADVVITMGCGDACPMYPGKRYLDWAVDDPAGRPLTEVRAIRDHIASLVEDLVRDFGIRPAA
ncbi:MAG: heat-shock protein HtpX [Dehalococcoidia bacterium]